MLVIVHPPGCKCGRHVKCGVCFDSGVVSVWFDNQGRHDGPTCKCTAGRKRAAAEETKT